MGGNFNGIAQGVGGGLLAGSAVLGVYLAADAYAMGASSGDWLAFSGVFLGVSFTIAGTLTIDKIKESMKRRALLDALKRAAGDWVASIDGFGHNQNVAGLNELEEQASFIASITPDIGRHDVRVAVALHAFNFNVPDMLQVLRRNIMMVDRGAQQQVSMNKVLTLMRGHGVQVIREAQDA